MLESPQEDLCDKWAGSLEESGEMMIVSLGSQARQSHRAGPVFDEHLVSAAVALCGVNSSANIVTACSG